ncbi:MAG: hypothetical protein ACLP3C_36130 [Mycobacterium sp.]|uniref:hypothetical protein n=1 Tax=Mycobacterium sp. TaxID=1785 RepID=UPI003F9E30FF
MAVPLGFTVSTRMFFSASAFAYPRITHNAVLRGEVTHRPGISFMWNVARIPVGPAIDLVMTTAPPLVLE